MYWEASDHAGASILEKLHGSLRSLHCIPATISISSYPARYSSFLFVSSWYILYALRSFWSCGSFNSRKTASELALVACSHHRMSDRLTKKNQCSADSMFTYVLYWNQAGPSEGQVMIRPMSTRPLTSAMRAWGMRCTLPPRAQSWSRFFFRPYGWSEMKVRREFS